MKKWSLLFIFVVFTLSFVGGCSSENTEKVDVYEMESFSVIKKDSLTSYTDSDDVSHLVKAFKKAKKEPGIVDMVDPDYKVEFGEESYYLWISKEQGTIMNLDDTNFIYTLSQSSAKTIYELLN
ncbi:hypothetical protein SAMN04487975_11049 [Planococcus glaciei]|uniref:hypothetical protein n=1 Tax=Planococcus glaciei TaxID=459472 RepID=UPI00088DE5D5|nr:hypothetical protein [Planococcus glaciei]SDH95022.1 hypothetical protein SAMN04487975_11049 [Planococcus glaciei]